MYGPQAALIAECFTPRLRYTGASIGYQLSSIISGGPAPLIATALFAAFGSGYVIALYILFCAIVSIVATALTAGLHQSRHFRGARQALIDPPAVVAHTGRGLIDLVVGPERPLPRLCRCYFQEAR